MNYSFVTMSDLENRIANLKRELEAFKSGKKYTSMKKEYSDMLAYEERIISRLKTELAAAHAQTRKVRESWYSTCEYVASENSRKMKQQETRIRNLENEVEALKLKNISDRKQIKEEYEEKLEEKDAIIAELQNKLVHYEALLNSDSTNSGIPTAQTPLNKKKIIPNTREKSNKPKGGQPGHKKHTLETPDENEVTAVEEHTLGEDDACCNCKNSDFVYTGESNNKYVYDVEIKVKKIKHVYYIYRCQTCGQLLRTKIEPGTKEQCQYGPTVQALALSLTNTSNSPINKTAMFLNGITGNELSPCEGYISKLQRRAATGLNTFMNDLRRLLITRSLLYWDDTVIMIKTKRGCLRFYGDDRIAYYTAHNHKDLDSLEDDKILKLLTKETMVMHDHNTVNYNERFCFSNIECNQHLQRNLKKSAEETNHKELLELKELISETIHKRKEFIKQGRECFEPS